MRCLSLDRHAIFTIRNLTAALVPPSSAVCFPEDPGVPALRHFKVVTDPSVPQGALGLSIKHHPFFCGGPLVASKCWGVGTKLPLLARLARLSQNRTLGF